MASALYLSNLCLFIIILSSFQILATVQAQGKNVNAGEFLLANYGGNTWPSPNGDFAFGFHPIPGEEDRFLLAIWYAKIPEETIVWYCNETIPIERGSKVALNSSGHLVLTDREGRVMWRSPSLNDDAQLSHAAMLDTGNFVIASKSNSGNIWESFKYPTDTILPTQQLDVNISVLSTFSETSYNKGKYQLRFKDGSLVLNQIDTFAEIPYSEYENLGNGSRLIFNESGYIQLQSLDGNLFDLAPEMGGPVPDPKSNYYRATLNFYGVLTLYSHPRNGESWFAWWFAPKDICKTFQDATARIGDGPCGYNSICEPELSQGWPNCTCPPGFSSLDANNPYIGCKSDYASYPGVCNPNGSTNEKDRFEMKSRPFVDFPYSDYGIFQPATKLQCEESCLLDCNCAVAILQDRSLGGNGTCWKKKLPLSNGRIDREDISRTALFKVPKSDPATNPNPNPNPGDENQNEVNLLLAVLLGASGVFNLFALTAISLIFFCLYQRKLTDFSRIPSRRYLETKIRSFTYKDLELATNRFKEELGRGAFGTVYKGELPSNYGSYVAVKKLDKFVRDGEREFKTEVKVIGQTHHKNLVALLGYCDEGEHRLLVYEFMENGSLSNFLFGKIRPSWQQRLQIASGIAKGLAYLHEECNSQIIHCDIKPQNILLDDSFNAKISDFGLAKLLINSNTRTLTGIRGTKGYVAPEWFRNTAVTVKVDVYSFGVMLLEIICCRRCVEVELEEAAILTEWAYECYSGGLVEKLVENDEEARCDLGKLEMLLRVAIWCVQYEPMSRPSMRTVSLMLEGAVEVPCPPCPFPLNSELQL